MADERNFVEVVHPGPPEGAVADRKSSRLDEMDLEPQARRQA
jgi:hypothetical protein